MAKTTPPTERSLNRVLITVSIMLATIMQAIDNTIANVALPQIQGALSSTQDQMAWVLTSYIIAAAIMTPLSGWLATRLGRKRVFLYSVVGFTIASVLCGAAQSLPEIVAARLAQGICGAALVPLSQAVLLDINPPEGHARAMAVWMMAATIGPIIGPVLGGWLTEHYNWRWVFYINVPFGIFAFLGIARFMPEAPLRKLRFDIVGFSALIIAIGALQLMLDRGQLQDWFGSTEIWVEATVSAVAFYLFTVHMLTTDKEPFVSASIFKDRNFLTGNVFIFVAALTLYGTLALLPPLLQQLMGYPVVTAGLVTAPRGIGTLIAMFTVGRIIQRVGPRLVIATGLALTAFSLWQMTEFSTEMDAAPVIWSGLIQGFGAGLAFVPVATVTFATLPSSLRNEGTALFSLVRNLGSSIGISVIEILLSRNGQIMQSTLGEHVTPYNVLLRPQFPALSSAELGLASLERTVTQQASMIAYNNDFKFMMVAALCAIPLVLLLQKAPSKEGTGTVVME
jgi:DHA2 family multidrug resistance protein